MIEIWRRHKVSQEGVKQEHFQAEGSVRVKDTEDQVDLEDTARPQGRWENGPEWRGLVTR